MSWRGALWRSLVGVHGAPPEIAPRRGVCYNLQALRERVVSPNKVRSAAPTCGWSRRAEREP